MWVPVHNEDWEGDVWTGSDQPRCPPSPREGKKSGMVTFKGNTLPWLVGQYEVRYHHDGKYNVMALDGSLEIFGKRSSLVILSGGSLIAFSFFFSFFDNLQWKSLLS